MTSGVQAETQGSAPGARQPDGTTGSGAVGAGGGTYAPLDAVVWRPVHAPTAQAFRIRIWTYASLGAAVAVVAATVVWAIVTGSFSPGLLGVLVAVAGGVLLLGAGLGHLEGEALAARTARIAAPVAPTGVTTSFLGDDTPAGAVPLNSEVVRALRDAPRGLTAGRTAVFAGAFLLAVAAVCGTIVLASAASAGARPVPVQTVVVTPAGPAPTASASVSPTPEASSPAAQPTGRAPARKPTGKRRTGRK